jgi:hypothetical protein
LPSWTIREGIYQRRRPLSKRREAHAADLEPDMTFGNEAEPPPVETLRWSASRRESRFDEKANLTRKPPRRNGARSGGHPP